MALSIEIDSVRWRARELPLLASFVGWESAVRESGAMRREAVLYRAGTRTARG